MEVWAMGDCYEEARMHYAEQIRVAGGVRDSNLLKTFSQVRRELFLPPGPWSISGIHGDYHPSDSSETPEVLHAVAIAMDLGQGLNNGNPAIVARHLEAMNFQPGETVFHVGAGLGYYTAIIATLVGPTGKVIAAEINPDLRHQAVENLAHFPNVEVCGDALMAELPPLDAIFSSCGASDIPARWLHALNGRGRILLPFTGRFEAGHVLLFTQKPEQPSRFSIRSCGMTRFYPCKGTDHPALAQEVDQLLMTNALARCEELELRLDPHPPSQACLLHRPQFCILRT